MKGENNKIYINAIGLNTLFLLSKDLFPSNNDIKTVSGILYNIELKDYLFSSRTMLIARTNRYIYDLDDDQVREFTKKLKKFQNDSIIVENNIESNYKPLKKKPNSKDNLKKWLNNI